MGTINKSALPSTYTLAAQGACFIDLMGEASQTIPLASIRIYVGTSAPSDNFAAYAVLAYNERGFSYPGTENVYIKSNDGTTHLCVVIEVV